MTLREPCDMGRRAHPPPWWTFHPAEPGVVFRVKKSETASRRTVSKKVFAGAMSVLTKCFSADIGRPGHLNGGFPWPCKS
jgi:hypothetical protein